MNLETQNQSVIGQQTQKVEGQSRSLKGSDGYRRRRTTSCEMQLHDGFLSGTTAFEMQLHDGF